MAGLDIPHNYGSSNPGVLLYRIVYMSSGLHAEKGQFTSGFTFQNASDTILDRTTFCRVKAGNSIPACWRQNSLRCDTKNSGQVQGWWQAGRGVPGQAAGVSAGSPGKIASHLCR